MAPIDKKGLVLQFAERAFNTLVNAAGLVGPMQVILDHIAKAVRPALRKYAEAERALDAAHKSGDEASLETARQDLMLAARGAVDLLHHLADFVFKEPSPALPAYAEVGRSDSFKSETRNHLKLRLRRKGSSPAVPRLLTQGIAFRVARPP